LMHPGEGEDGRRRGVVSDGCAGGGGWTLEMFKVVVDSRTGVFPDGSARRLAGVMMKGGVIVIVGKMGLLEVSTVVAVRFGLVVGRRGKRGRSG
jgi:hypothetical protein